MLLQLLAPQSSMISKGKQAMWHYIEENLLPMLSQATVDAKSEEYVRCLDALAEELAALREKEQQLENSSDDFVETTADNGSPDDPSDDIMMD